MEPPVASSGPVFRRAATFSYRQERALKDVNGRVSVLNKSQEHPSTSKIAIDGQKVVRPTKQYSTVASRYAAPLVSKKQHSSVADGLHGVYANVTKLPFITGRSGALHQRKPSADNLSSFQPPMVFAATARDPKPDTLVKKVDASSYSLLAKRPRVTKRASMVEKSQIQTREPRFYSLDKGGCACSKNASLTGSGDESPASLLYSAAHWLFLIKLAEGEEKHEVVIDLFRLAITLKAEPTDDVMVHLKRYQESHSSDQVVTQLVQQCEGTQQEAASTNTEVIDKAVCKPEDSKNTAYEVQFDISGEDSLSKIIVVPPIVSESAPPPKDVPKKPPHFMGRMLSRSSTFSCVDASSKSQHAKAEYGKKLAKTVEFLAMQAAAHSPSLIGVVAQPCPTEAQNAELACASEVETIGKASTTLEVNGKVDVQPTEEPATPMPTLRIPLPIPDDLPTPSFDVASGIEEMRQKECNVLAAVPATPVSYAGSRRLPALGNGSAEKPVDSLSEWLDGESTEMGTPDIESALTEDIVDLSPNCRGSVKHMDVDSLMKEVVSHILPHADVSSTADRGDARQNGAPTTLKFHVRRKSWQDAREQSMTEIVENITRSHRHSLSSEAVLLSVRGSVEEKVKLFTELAEVGGATSSLSESAPGSGSRESLDAESVQEPKVASEENDISQIAHKEALEIETPVEYAHDSLVETALAIVHNEGSKVPLATPIRVSMKGVAVPLSILATPNAATPCESASVGIPRARHRRASSVGNITPRGPFDMTAKCSPFSDNTSSSSSGQSSISKSNRMPRGYKDVTPRMNFSKPSWKAIVEREMKGSKLKDLLAAELPEESSPLAEFLQRQMENQNRGPESGSSGAKERDMNSTCCPAKSMRKLTRSSSKKQLAPKEVHLEGVAEPRTAQKHKNHKEGEQEMDTSAADCATPGSAIRRSSRIQSKVQSRTNTLFKEEFVLM